MRKINSSGRQELAIVVAVANSGPRGGKNLQLFYQAAIGIRPTDFSGADPLKSVVGKQCRVVLAPRADGKGERVVAVVAPPSPQLEFAFDATS
ncbi:MAG: hypothetical protein QGG39_10305 [Candidatus Poribacteria bacterium]|nr:hypothetical protein [Candidatus Poribacteria bacterium]